VAGRDALRSRASGVARLETVAGPFILNSRLRVRFGLYIHGLWTHDAGRAGAHPYHATTDARERIPRDAGRAGVHPYRAHKSLSRSTRTSCRRHLHCHRRQNHCHRRLGHRSHSNLNPDRYLDLRTPFDPRDPGRFAVR
jgi:hypothetical protein